MRTVVVTDPPRADIGDADTLGEYGTATVHEALGRVGYLGPELRPAWAGARIGGTAVPVFIAMAASFGLTGDESHDELAGDRALLGAGRRLPAQGGPADGGWVT